MTILSKEWPSWTDKARLSSQAAGALWKCLPLECGPQAVLDNLSTSQRWTLESYKLYSAMASIPELKKIVELRPCTIVTTGDIEGNMIFESKLQWLQENNIPGFRRGTDLFDEYGLNTEHSEGLIEAYEYTAPVIDVDLAMVPEKALWEVNFTHLETSADDSDNEVLSTGLRIVSSLSLTA